MDIYGRCDTTKDCDDGSDEDECSLIDVPANYDKSAAPKHTNGEELTANEIFLQVKIINFDFIDALSNTVGLTVELKFNWVDPKVDFENAKDVNDKSEELRIVPQFQKDKIWLPIQELVFDNAVIGEIVKEDVYILEVNIKSAANTRSVNDPKESLVYPGAKNPLHLSQKLKISFRCNFFVQNFPFDKDECQFYLSLPRLGNNTIVLREAEEYIIYKGQLILNEFQINSLKSMTEDSPRKTSFILAVQFQRLYQQHLISTFLQSFLLWFLSYLTFFIDIEDFSNRFMGAITSLLVLASLLGAMQASLPKTAYFKIIDIWFNWFLGNIFIIILFHIILDYLYREDGKVVPIGHQKIWNVSNCLHNIFKIIVLIINLTFVIIYFSFSIFIF